MLKNSPKRFSATWVAVLALSLFFCPPVDADQSLELAWNPTTATGGSGYRVYYGATGTNFQHVVDVGTNSTCELAGLQEGSTNSFVVTAYNAQGVESLPSNLISYIVPGIVNIAPKAGPGSPMVISFPVAPGHTYEVQASSDLTTWSMLWQTTATNNAWTQFADVEPVNSTMRFYRVVWQ